jgi:coproporphyrinogen III oxidase-like Fe-S oxidoreductase
LQAGLLLLRLPLFGEHDIKAELVKAIIRELELQAHYLGGEPLETIYFGGGTPSLLTEAELNSILKTIISYIRLPQLRKLHLRLIRMILPRKN